MFPADSMKRVKKVSRTLRENIYSKQNQHRIFICVGVYIDHNQWGGGRKDNPVEKYSKRFKQIIHRWPNGTQPNQSDMQIEYIPGYQSTLIRVARL